jgi:hypothetical protein
MWQRRFVVGKGECANHCAFGEQAIFCREDKQVKKSIVAVNERGRRIGESHPRAVLTDHEVDLIRELAEQGLTYGQIAEKFDMPAKRSSRVRIGKIVRCEVRAQTVAGHRKVRTQHP